MSTIRRVAVVAIVLAVALFSAGQPRVTLAAGYTFVALPVGAVAPANDQVMPPGGTVQARLDTSSSAWTPSLNSAFQAGYFGLRLLNTATGTILWLLPKGIPVSYGSLTVSNAITFDKSTGVVTARPGTLPYGAPYGATLATGAALPALIARDLHLTVNTGAALCCAYPSSSTAPWSFTTARATATSSSSTSTSASGIVNATISGVTTGAGVSSLTAGAIGKGTATVAAYTSSPTSVPTPFTPSGAYFDVYASLGNTFQGLTITSCNGGATLYWYTGSSWQRVSSQAWSGGCLQATITGSSSPSLSQLTGTVIAGALPTITAVSPATGRTAGGDAVEITGSGFTGVTSVQFGGIPVGTAPGGATPNFTVLSDSAIDVSATPPGSGAVDVTVTTPGGASTVSSADRFTYTTPANLLTNGDFSSGLSGWMPDCKGWSGQGYTEGAGCGSFYTTSPSGIQMTGFGGGNPYEGVYQIVPAAANSILQGTVTVGSMSECGDGSVAVSVSLLDANKNPLGATLNADPMFGNITFAHHPYTGCAPYVYGNTSTSFFQDMPAWTASSGSQTFTMDIGAIIARGLPGIDPSQVAYVKVQLTDYADVTSPIVTFGQLSLTSGVTVNVKDYGAAGDGITDDTAAFQSALGYLNGAGGGMLAVPAGTYLVDPSSLVVKSSIRVLGHGATLKAAGIGYQLLDVAGVGVTVAGLGLDGADDVVRGISIEPSSSHVVLVHDTVQAIRQPTDPASPSYDEDPIGIQIYGNTDTVLIDSLAVTDVVADHPDCATCTHRVARGIRISPSSGQTIATNVTIQNSVISHVGPKDDGDCIVAQDSNDAASLTITHDSFDYCAKRAIKIQVPGVVVSNNTIDNPYLNDNFTAVQYGYDQAAFPYDMYAAISVYTSNVTVSGNSIGGAGSFYNGIEIGDPCSSPSNVTVQNNAVSMGSTSYTTAASLIRAMGPVNGLTIAGNTGGYADNGIELASSAGANVSGNSFINVAQQLAYYAAPCS